MPIPSTINDLSITAGSNSPSGGETPTEGDNYLRSLSAFIAQLRDKLNGTSSTGTVNSATFTGTHTFSSGNLVATTYVPTVAGGSNVVTTTSGTFRYVRVGNTVRVSGDLTVTPSVASGTATTVSISLPVVSNFTGASNVSGVGAQTSFPGTHVGGGISADSLLDVAVMTFYANYTGSSSWRVVFEYDVI